jgi:hypothetical protein
MLVSDGAGGAIIAWEDANPSGHGVCVEHLTAMGLPAPGWSAPGIMLMGASQPWIAAEGAHGGILSWAVGSSLNYRRIVNGEPFSALAFDPVGSSLPASALKVPHNEFPIVISDRAGGLLVGWKHMSLTGDKLMFQRLAASGAAATSAVFIYPNFRNDYDPGMCDDGAAGAILAWRDMDAEGNILARRVLSDGTMAPSWPADPLVVCAEAGTQRATGIVADGAGGAIIVWRDGRNGLFEQIYAQHVTSDGAIAAGWPAGGRAICTNACDAGDQRFNGTYYESSSPLTSDGVGGAFIVWSDRRADEGDIYCQHILADGSLAAPENGIALCAAPGLQSRPEITADGTGGALACWEDARGGEADIYAQRIGADGALAPAWPKDGLAVCTAAGEQRVPQIVSDGASGAVIAWQDGRGGDADIYAARVTGDAVVPALASLVSAEGRPGLARLVWYAAGPLGPRVTVQRRASPGDWTPLADVSPDGSGFITFEDHDVTAGHRYGYRLALTGGAATSYRGETWLDIADGPRLALGAPYPNPSPDEVQVPFALPGGAGGALELLDLSGRAIETHPLAGLGVGAHVLRLATGRVLPPGLYCVRLTHAGATLTARFAIVR